MIATSVDLQLGIIGLGHIGRVHLAALAASPGLSVVALCDRDGSLAAIAPPEVPFFADPKAFFACPMDAVVVATPNHTHGTIALEALQHGHRVIIEKPAARSLDELDALIEAGAPGARLHFAFHAAHGREVIWARDWLRQQPQLGPIVGFEVSFLDPYATDGGQLVEAATSLENAWRDSGINALSVLAEFIDPFALRLTRTTVHKRSNRGVPIDVAVEFAVCSAGATHEGVGIIATRWTPDTNHKQTLLRFSAGDDFLRLDHSAQTVTIITPTGSTLLADLAPTGERLFNHYVGLFSAYRGGLYCNSTMVAAGRRIHELLFLAANEIEAEGETVRATPGVGEAVSDSQRVVTGHRA